jgi:3-oxoacyl-[acyl-carrier protein] reductase
MIDLTGHHALITGGTRGIGAAVAAEFHSYGARVTVTGRSSARPEIPEAYDYLNVDFTDRVSTDSFLKQVESMNSLDILVNNAGINRNHLLTEFPEADFDVITETNYRAPFLVMQAAARAMIRNKAAGRIVNIASIWATHTRAGRSAYCASKSGILGLTRAAATDLAPHGIIVNAVSPGFVETDLTSSTLGAAGILEVTAQIPMGRLAQPSEIARIAVMLASPANTYLTGQNIIIDGGFTNV